MPKPRKHYIAPGVPARTARPPAHRPTDETTLCDWVRFTLPDGSVAYRPRPLGRWAKVGRKLERAIGASAETLRRLNAAGFIEMQNPSPGLWNLDLDSWARHLEATDPAENPDFWEEGQGNLERYRFRNGEYMP